MRRKDATTGITASLYMKTVPARKTETPDDGSALGHRGEGGVSPPVGGFQGSQLGFLAQTSPLVLVMHITFCFAVCLLEHFQVTFHLFQRLSLALRPSVGVVLCGPPAGSRSTKGRIRTTHPMPTILPLCNQQGKQRPPSPSMVTAPPKNTLRILAKYMLSF